LVVLEIAATHNETQPASVVQLSGFTARTATHAQYFKSCQAAQAGRDVAAELAVAELAATPAAGLSAAAQWPRHGAQRTHRDDVNPVRLPRLAGMVPLS
jgi:hypothetical protein